jgi:hypothetical protein
MLDSSLLIAAGASFIAGVLGYIIAKLWIKPIVHYNITKRKLDRDLSRCLAPGDETAGSTLHEETNGETEALRAARKHAMDLVACYGEEIPYWYRLLLDSRQESPTEASGLLTNLSKMRDREQVKARIESARKKMGLR